MKPLPFASHSARCETTATGGRRPMGVLLTTLLCLSACSSDHRTTSDGAGGSAGAAAGEGPGGASDGGAGGAGSGGLAGSAGSGSGGLMVTAGGAPANGMGGAPGTGGASAGGSTTGGAGGGPATACTREGLRAVTDQYFEALAARDPSALPLATTVKFTENGAQLELGEGLWANAGTATFTLTALDTAICTSVTEAVVADGSTDIPFGLRLKLENQAITEIETIAVRSGDYVVASNTGNIAAVNADEWEASLPLEEQWSRDEHIAYVDKYFKLFPEGACDFAPGCQRLENGFPFDCTALASCSAEEPSGEGAMTPRLHVIDVEAGIAVGLVMFIGGYTDFHIFKIQGGQVLGVNAILGSATSSGWD